MLRYAFMIILDSTIQVGFSKLEFSLSRCIIHLEYNIIRPTMNKAITYDMSNLVTVPTFNVLKSV